MTALSADRDTPSRDGKQFSFPCAASKTFYAGAIIVLDTAGNAEPASAATGKIAAGRCVKSMVSTTAAAEQVPVEAGVFRFVNGETITKAHIGDAAFAFDDQTIYRTASGLSQIGTIVDVDSLGVWVAISAPLAASATGLLAANNLSDVTSAATARSNLALDTGDSPTFTGVTATGNVAITGTLKVAGARTGRPLMATKTSTYTLDVPANDGDMTIADATDNAVITLPACAAGNLGQRVTVLATGANGATKISISPNSANAIFGGVNGGSGGALVTFGGVNDKDAILTKATMLKGDYVTLQSDGSTGWYVVAGQGIWASEA